VRKSDASSSMGVSSSLMLLISSLVSLALLFPW
jgi:hypothetical protein